VIVTHLIGGLGNQMFQYAIGRRLAHDRGTDLELDLSGYVDQSMHATARRYELGCFRIRAGIARARDLPGYEPRSPLARLAARLVPPAGPRLEVVHEPRFTFDPGVLDAPDGTALFGYWQCERYFDAIAPLIRSDFEFVEPPRGANADMLAEIRGVEAVSVHVRRGDYVSDARTNAFHGTASLDYYRDALATIAATVDRPSLFVFSDDPAWCKEHLRSDLPTTYADHNPPERGHEDLRLMVGCRHHVLANSSFSWWGAWLNPSPDKVVVAPRRWFQDDSVDTSDLIPRGWIRI